MRNTAVYITTVLVLALATGGVLVGSPGLPGVRLEPAKTWVGLARVHLSVSDLKVVDKALVGTYEIHIPLAPDKDDRGTVRFELERPLDQTLVEGSVLLGLGQSTVGPRTHRIRCAFGDDDSVRIEVDSGDRRLSFRSRWVPAS